MDWKRARSGKTTEGYYMILSKKRVRVFVKAYREGGVVRRLPYQDFESEEDAMDWVEAHEKRRSSRKARLATEKPISF